MLFVTLHLCLLCYAADATTMPFNVVQYNLFGRPYTISHDGQNERLERVPDALLSIALDVDVVTFAEADNDQEVELMAKAFANAGYNYRTSVVKDHEDKSLVNGGVLIGSKWPILREDQIVYRDACSGSDCLAAKGVKYARVLKTDPATNLSKVFNVFGTHMQAWYTEADKADRVKQAQQLKDFVVEQGIPREEPVIIGGDFNNDLVRYPGEVMTLLSILNATMPQLVGDTVFTSDPGSNLLVGRDSAADACADGYTKSWGAVVNKTYVPGPSTRLQDLAAWPPSTDTGEAVLPFFHRVDNQSYCPCCPFEWLDYILVSQEHQQPSTSQPAPTLGALPIKAPPFPVPWDGAMQPVPDPPVVEHYMSLTDLSDHYPVYAQFHFDVTGPQPPTLGINGCRKDSDCSFHASVEASCYCDGPGCTWNGTHRNGWDTGASDPVNANCHYSLPSVACICHKGT